MTISEPGNGSEPAGNEGGEEVTPGSMTSLEQKQDSDDSSSPNLPKTASRQLHALNATNPLTEAQTAAVARVVHDAIGDRPIGHYVPEEMPRERRERVLKAEALWRAGVLSVQDIAREISGTPKTVYEWAQRYFWPKRANLVALGQEAVQKANIAMAAQVMPVLPPGAENSSSSAVDEDPANVAPRAQREISHDDQPIDFMAERASRPMSEEQARESALVANAAAQAFQTELIDMYVKAISAVVQQQQKAANMAVQLGEALLADLTAAYEHEKAMRAKKMTAKEMRKEVAETLPMYRQLVSSLSQAIALQRRVFMIADAKGSGGEGFVEGSGGLGNDESQTGVAVPVPQQTYEHYILEGERAGKDFTKE